MLTQAMRCGMHVFDSMAVSVAAAWRPLASWITALCQVCVSVPVHDEFRLVRLHPLLGDQARRAGPRSWLFPPDWREHLLCVLHGRCACSAWRWVVCARMCVLGMHAYVCRHAVRAASVFGFAPCTACGVP